MTELIGLPPATTPAPASTSMTRPAPGRTPRIEPRPDLPTPAAGSTPWEDTPEPIPAAGTTEIIEVRARPAALWQRITAFIVDGALVGGVLALYVGLAAALITPHGVPATQLTGIDGVMARVHQLHAVLAPCVALAVVLGLVYTAAFALLWNGRTPGRRLLGIRLVDRTGLAPAPGRAIARAALAIVSFLPFLAGFWLALFDRRGQTLHDKLTQTFVIRPG
ncbi:MAG TPA: RDD family protein [Myxococcaceae bacterium]|nr:RDD family protein [Myxococcaceae bacterium]